MKQGEIWLAQLYPAMGAEINKIRPCVIISNDDIGILPLRIVVPITDWKECYAKYPWMVKIVPNDKNGLVKTSSIDCFQVRSVSVERLVKLIGTVSKTAILQIQDTIMQIIGAD